MEQNNECKSMAWDVSVISTHGWVPHFYLWQSRRCSRAYSGWESSKYSSLWHLSTFSNLCVWGFLVYRHRWHSFLSQLGRRL